MHPRFAAKHQQARGLGSQKNEIAIAAADGWSVSIQASRRKP